MDFRNYIRDLARDKSNVLEIGPSYNPIASKSDGFNVKIIDHASSATLKEKYGAYGIDTTKIEDVDFITTDISSIESEGIFFDLIIASHVIEHSTDIIDFINQCNTLLTDDGRIALLIPDKRYCFDTYRPCSSIGTAIDAHLAGRNKHLGSLFDHYAYFCTRNGSMAWGERDTADLSLIHTSEQCLEAFHKSQLGDEYVDAHEWVFTPSSFRLMLSELRNCGFISVGIDFSHPTLGYEFLSILSRKAPMECASRLDMLRSIRNEEIAASPIGQAASRVSELLNCDVQDIGTALERHLNSLESEHKPAHEINTSLDPKSERRDGDPPRKSWKFFRLNK